MLEERRTHYRLRVNLPVIYTIFFSDVSVTKKSITHDLSDEGLSFYTDVYIKTDAELKINLPPIFDAPKKSIVKWCSKKDDNFYRVGVCFQ